MSKRVLFGTDGIRGKANIYPMTGDVAFTLGRAVTCYFQAKSNKNKRPLVIIGKDTRRSCYMLEQAFSAGVCSQGGEVVLTGPLPTPAVAFVTQSLRADAGIMISASHNAFDDNGIKLFDASGYKLPDEVEEELEKMVLDPSLMDVKLGESLGNAKRLKEVYGRYLVQTKAAFPAEYDLEGMRVVLDCANGASYKITPMMFRELGAEVISIGVSPNGTNINYECGALHPNRASEYVMKYRADMGVCLDGDADRLIVVDENGKVIDGDQVIGLFAKLLLDKGILKKGDPVVGTVMSNLGLEKFIEKIGLKFIRTKVGDRYIMEAMKTSFAILGGEPSGHIIFKQHATTGDGSLAALKLIESMKFYKKSVSELTSEVDMYPQVLKNVVVASKPPFEDIKEIQDILKVADDKLKGTGRVLLRYSGTEPKVRVMVEGQDFELVNSVCDEIITVIKNILV